MASESKTINFPSVDDCLGAAEKRFFGGGYKRVGHEIRDLRVASDGSGAGFARATARLAYPADWSTKSGSRSLRPHLSTIDAAVLAIELAEIYLVCAFGLSEEQRRSMWLRRLVMRAGAEPQEDLLEFPVRAVHRKTGADLGPATGTETEPLSISNLECQVGAIKVTLDIAHAPGNGGAATAALWLADGFLGDPAKRFYGEGFRKRTQHIRDVAIDLDSQHVTSLVDVVPDEPAHLYDQGFAGRFQPSVSAVDGMIVLAQLAQSMLYSLDRVERGSSNTLWMRRVALESTGPERQIRGPFPVSTKISRTRLLNFQGGVWRTSEWTADFHGIHFAYSLGHEIPASELSMTKGR
ncbi:conserved protein of unknown function [Streptomyces murinus]|uniref:AvrD family protein n=1 Tax=Streptomyces murinus TaxID=33900 RepID=UPI003D672488